MARPTPWRDGGTRIRGPLEAQAIKILQATAVELDKRGVTRARWAIAAGMDRGTIWKILRRRRPMMIQTLDKLMDAAAVLSDYSVRVNLVMEAD